MPIIKRPQFKKSKILFGKNKIINSENDIAEEEDNQEELIQNMGSNILINGTHLYFHGDITGPSCLRLISSINKIVSYTMLIDPINPYSIPIYLHINTDGGEVYKVLGVISHIKTLKNKIITICEGCVASAGVLLSLSGSERWIYSNAYMLVHEIRSGVWGKYSECIDDMYNNKKIMKDIKKYFNKETHNKFPEDIMEKILKRDILLKPKKCLKYGLVDKIIDV